MAFHRLAHPEQTPSALATNTPGRMIPSRTGTAVFCGHLPYGHAWDLQRTFRAERAADRRPDLLLLMEHPAVFTLGRTTQDGHWPGEEHLARQTGIPIIRTERGGSITYHGPGQAVGYPILRLSDYCAGPKAYVHRLEEMLIATLAEWGIAGHRRERLPGVWVGGSRPSKIAFIGVRIARGITTHGFALNVSLDLTPFSHIVPCGIADCPVTSMETVLGTVPDMRAVQQRITARFGEQFHLRWTHSIGPESLNSFLNTPAPPLENNPGNVRTSHEE